MNSPPMGIAEVQQPPSDKATPAFPGNGQGAGLPVQVICPAPARKNDRVLPPFDAYGPFY